MNNTGIIIRREYLERVNKKSFIITTLLVPLLMLALMVLPTVMMVMMPTETKTLVVIDDSGIILPELENTDDVKFISAFGSQEQMLASDSIYGVLIIERNILANNNAVKLLTPNSASNTVEQAVTSQMEKIIETRKLKNYNIENLDEILNDVHTEISIQSIRVDDNGEEDKAQSATLDAIVGTVLNLVLYMFLILYGAMIMNSIIEEKNNRVLEIVVSSVKPTQLMLGKIVGVGLVAFTQIAIWAVIIYGASALLLPALIPADVLAEAAAINSGSVNAANASMDFEMAHMLDMFTNVGYVLGILGLLIVFLIGGYMLYAAIFAAIGAAVDNQQDAAQLQTIGIIPIFIGLFASMGIVNDPDSTFALVMSLIPFTSPMVMMARVPFGIPWWETALSLTLLIISIAFMIWFAAKIYRVGIFMYGKKPTVRDLIRWARYK